MASSAITNQPSKRTRLWKRIVKHWPFYLFILPAFVWYAIFSYYPMTGLALAFQKYSLQGGYFNNQWVGMRYFNDFLKDPRFWQVVEYAQYQRVPYDVRFSGPNHTGVVVERHIRQVFQKNHTDHFVPAALHFLGRCGGAHTQDFFPHSGVD